MLKRWVVIPYNASQAYNSSLSSYFPIPVVIPYNASDLLMLLLYLLRNLYSLIIVICKR